MEVALALGIVAFAFVSLFGLLPSGLSVFRNSIDVGNETWIMQGLNSMIQVTEWPKIEDKSLEKEIFYYNEEGRLTDTKSNPGSAKAQASRLYAVKILIDDFSRPAESAPLPKSVRVIALFANVSNPTAMQDFEGTKTVTQAGALKISSQVRSRAFVVACMDSLKP